ncbi:myozenin-2-like [Dunckerocampus dactyliophorus]|uniref:myozenin-2-like n=1 Tax=Dunckerocampus dactyliophorus TaxID=161453 RepID=UPI0024054FD6|nr:myozenin-2-like [Dunckerocampus dactyliophorus]
MPWSVPTWFTLLSRFFCHFLHSNRCNDRPLSKVLQGRCSHVAVLHHDEGRERKLQAEAICREVQALEDVEMDLGKKVSVPKDIMLEELSLASNRGSRLFKMRQRRSEKYTFESIQNYNNTHMNNTVDSLADNSTEDYNTDNQACTVDTTEMVPHPDAIAPGYGGPLKDVAPEKFNSTAVPKSYHSPWKQAIISDPALAETLITHMSEPEAPTNRPGYKSFNRVATPFGGFSKAPQTAPFKSPNVESTLPEYPELKVDSAPGRPTFNRSALGWVSTEAPVTLSTTVCQLPESDDL